MKKETLINFRVSEELKDAFKEVVNKEGYGLSSVLEASMKDIVKKGRIPINLRPYLSNGAKPITLPYIKKCLDEIIANHKVERVSIFGSFARGEETPNSDIDLLIEEDPDFSLFDLVELNNELEDRLGRKVDVVTKGSLTPTILAEVERDKIVIYEKSRL